MKLMRGHDTSRVFEFNNIFCKALLTRGGVKLCSIIWWNTLRLKSPDICVKYLKNQHNIKLIYALKTVMQSMARVGWCINIHISSKFVAKLIWSEVREYMTLKNMNYMKLENMKRIETQSYTNDERVHFSHLEDLWCSVLSHLVH